MQTLTTKTFLFGDFELDAAKRLLLKKSHAVALNSKAFDLLLVLVENHNRVLSKDELLEKVWANQFVEENNLTVQIAALRKILGEKKGERRFIVTIPGRGYQFIAELNKPPSEIIVESHSFSRIFIKEEIEKSNEADEKLLGETNGHFAQSKEISLNMTELIAPKRNQIRLDWLKRNRVATSLIILITGLAAIGGGYIWQKQQFIFPAAASSPSAQMQIKRLTGTGRVNIAVLSADGKFFAYSHNDKGVYRTEIRVGQTNGSSDVVLVSKGDAVYNPTSFSSDGNWLYYVQSKPREFNDGTLYKIPVLGGVPQKLIAGINIYPAISPDEKQIAFVRSDQERKISALVVADINGANEREVVTRSLGQAIRGLSVAWSVDKQLIAFSAVSGKNDNREVFVANLANGNVNQITTLNWTELAKLEWLKDGSSLLAVARDKDSMAATQIWQIDYPSGAARKINSDLSNHGSALSLSADSNGFVVVQMNGESNIWVAPADNLEEAKQLTFGSLGRQDGWYGMDWSPDGRIVYNARINQSVMLWSMNADGSDVRQITPLGSQDRTPSVTADGQWIVFESNRSGKKEIWRVRFDGADLAQVTTDGGNLSPSVTPDGKWVIYQHSNDGEDSVWRIALPGGEPQPITDKDCYSPRVSPDGQFIACGYSGGGKMRLAVFSINGGEPLKTFGVPPTYNFDMGAIRWSPDGRFLYYRDWSNGVWRQPIDGREPQRIENLPAEKLYQFGWSPDGKQIAFARGREVRDAVLITNFR